MKAIELDPGVTAGVGVGASVNVGVVIGDGIKVGLGEGVGVTGGRFSNESVYVEVGPLAGSFPPLKTRKLALMIPMKITPRASAIHFFCVAQ